MIHRKLCSFLRLASLNASFFAIIIVSSAGDVARAAQASGPGGFDFSTTARARTYSPGLSISPNVGYGQPIWGNVETPWHGFLRPSITGVISPTIYEGKLGLEVFPVSILGVGLGRTFSRRFVDTRGQDCAAVQCQGQLDYTDFTVQTYLGGGGFFSSLRWTRTFFDPVVDQSRPIYDVGTSVLLKSAGDAGDYTTIIVGKDVADELALGVLIQNADFRYSGQHQEGQYLIVKSDLKNYGLNDIVAIAGLGRFKSDLNVAEVSAILSLTYTHTRAIGLGR